MSVLAREFGNCLARSLSLNFLIIFPNLKLKSPDHFIYGPWEGCYPTSGQPSGTKKKKKKTNVQLTYMTIVLVLPKLPGKLNIPSLLPPLLTRSRCHTFPNACMTFVPSGVCVPWLRPKHALSSHPCVQCDESFPVSPRSSSLPSGPPPPS